MDLGFFPVGSAPDFLEPCETPETVECLAADLLLRRPEFRRSESSFDATLSACLIDPLRFGDYCLICEPPAMASRLVGDRLGFAV